MSSKYPLIISGIFLFQMLKDDISEAIVSTSLLLFENSYHEFRIHM